MEKIVFTSVLDQFTSSPLWGWHFLVPPEIATRFTNGNDRRVVCTINNQIKLHCALMPNKETWFVMLNKDVQKKLNIGQNTEIQVSMVKDTSEYGMPMAEEFREVLDQESDADRYFHELTPGKQRSLLYLVNRVKNIDGKINKSLAIADHLCANQGKLDFKMLNEAFKEYNNK